MKVVTTSCTFISNVLTKLDSSEAETLILTAMEVSLGFVDIFMAFSPFFLIFYYRWILVGQWIHNYPECVRVVVSVAEKGLAFQHSNQTDANSGTIIGKRIKSCSEYYLYAFVGYFAQFPRGSGPDSTSALRAEVFLRVIPKC